MQLLADLDVLIVDCQTTGATPALGEVLELGWCVVRASEPMVRDLQAHWVALPPGHFVSRHVRRLTGFHESRSADALSPGDIWGRLRATMGSAERMPAAIHFARFELAFLRDWASRFASESPFPLDAVCVHALACRLYPDLPRRSIRALAGFLGHSVDLARRSEGHVEATAFIWRKLTSELAERGVATWEELHAWLAEAPAKRPRKRRYPMASAQYRALADRPGVYRFLRSNGDLLYVGKAASLRKRVASHFTAGRGATERALEMLTQVHHVDVTQTASALEAALLENESIKQLRPPYNVQLTSFDSVAWFASASFDTASPNPDDAHPHGPFPSAFSVRSLGAVLALVAGAQPTRSLRARAVGAADAWAPDEAVFDAGFRCFFERHFATCERAADVSGKRAVLTASKRLLREAKTAGPLPAPEDEESGPVPTWDPERVTRHLERAAAQGYQLLRRSRWLCILHDSVVRYREPGAEGSRVLVIHDGHVIEARDADAHDADAHDARANDALPTPPSPRRTHRERQALCDRAHYDRLRTLLSELKRVRRDGGEVVLRVGRGRVLEGPLVDALLFWV